jgi:hypothetical protein
MAASRNKPNKSRENLEIMNTECVGVKTISSTENEMRSISKDEHFQRNINYYIKSIA